MAKVLLYTRRVFLYYGAAKHVSYSQGDDHIVRAVSKPQRLTSIQCTEPNSIFHQFCEEFKESSTLCVPCGLQLADKAQPAVVRHFGLQILEHVIK